MIGRPDVEWGEHATGFAGAMAWVLPNPSRLNRSFSLDSSGGIIFRVSDGAVWQLGEDAQVDMIFDEIESSSHARVRACVQLGYSSMKFEITDKT